MSNAHNKAKGSLFENQVEEYLNKSGMKARRLPRAGSKDIGDVAIELKTGLQIVCELKNVKAVNMADFLRQADVEASNFENKYDCPTVGVVVVKARQRGIGEARVTLTLDRLCDLLNWSSLT